MKAELSTDGIKALVKRILQNPHAFEWEPHGLGFFKCPLDDVGGERYALHLWHGGIRASHVSDIHTHPWSFRSRVIVGWVEDWTYGWNGYDHRPRTTHKRRMVRCGEGLYENKEAEFGDLRFESMTILMPGQEYEHHANHIHRTVTEPGTVTLVVKKPRETDYPYVFWPIGKEFGSAKVLMTSEDVREALSAAAWESLNRYFA